MRAICLCLAFFLAAPAWSQAAGDDEIPAPEPLSVEPYRGGDAADGGWVLITFRAAAGVPGVTGYRIWRQIRVEYASDASGTLVRTAPRQVWVPWGRVDAVAGQEVLKVVVATLDSDAAPLGISTEVGDRHSSIALLPPLAGPATAVAGATWAAVKARIHGR